MHRGRSLWLFLTLVVAACLAITGSSAAAAAKAGWTGERIISSPAIGKGWEPAVAADPSAPYVYAAWMQFPKPYIAVSVSADGGGTWGTPKALCTNCAKQGQYDVTLAVTSSGTVYATFMKQYDIMFARSTDHGATWTAPLQVTNENKIYYYSNGGTVLPGGTAIMVGSEYPETGNSTKLTGPVPIAVFRSTNGGASWTRTVADTLYTGATFASSSVTTVASDASGTLALVYSGSLAVGANGHVFVRRSTDSGLTWSARTEMSTSAGGADATSVAAAGRGTGVFRITWMDARTGAWNVWERESADGGQTWTADSLVSNATTGAPYKTATGFGFPYGDYDTVAINSAGKTVAVMGEGDATQANGDIWANVQS